MLDYPGWIGDGSSQIMQTEDPYYFSHEDLFTKNGPITKVIIHAGDRIDGIELFYGGQSAPVRGGVSGSQHTVLEVRPGEMITGFSAKAGVPGKATGYDSYLSALKLTSTTENGTVGQTIQAGREDWIAQLGWTHTFDGHAGGLRDDDTKRLLWFSGWSEANGRGGWIYRLLPVFGHYQTWGPLQ